MTAGDRRRWDERYANAPIPEPRIPDLFAGYEHHFPRSGSALDVACGTGSGSLWMARRGLTVTGLDVSPVAVALAQQAAVELGLGDRCRFDVADLDAGLPAGLLLDVVLCHRFRAPSLYDSMARRLRPGGLLAIAVLSEVGGEPGPYRATPRELADAFEDLDVLVDHEAAGAAVLLARVP